MMELDFGMAEWSYVTRFAFGLCCAVAGWIVGWVTAHIVRRSRSSTSTSRRSASTYTATYESTVSGGGVTPGGDPRDEVVLEHVKHLALRHSELVTLEFGGVIIWTRERGWIGGDDNGEST